MQKITPKASIILTGMSKEENVVPQATYRVSRATESCLFCNTGARTGATVRLQRLYLLRKYANEVVAPAAIKIALHKQNKKSLTQKKKK